MVDLFLGVILLIPLWTDIKQGIIPNQFIVILIAYGLIINLYFKGWTGIVFSLSGLFVGLLIFLIPFILEGLGAGDVKLIAAIGAVKGMKFILIDSLLIAIIGGLISLVILISNRKQNNVLNDSFAYGIAITFGTWIVLWFL